MTKTAVIAAAGKATRARPESDDLHKSLFVVQGKTLLRHNVDLIVSQLGLREIYVIVGHLRAQVEAELERIQAVYPDIKFKAITWTEQGLAADVNHVSQRLGVPFFLTLGDEFYGGADFRNFSEYLNGSSSCAAAVGIIESAEREAIEKNYSVLLRKNRVVALAEKPKNPPNSILGVGLYLITPEFQTFFSHARARETSTVIELTNVLDQMARGAAPVFAVQVTGRYFNVNSYSDYLSLLEGIA